MPNREIPRVGGETDGGAHAPIAVRTGCEERSVDAPRQAQGDDEETGASPHAVDFAVRRAQAALPDLISFCGARRPLN